MKYASKVDHMLENYNELKKEFKWEMDISRHLVAMNFTIHNRNVRVDEIKRLMKTMKDETGLLSPFRGNMSFSLAGLLVSEGDHPQQCLKKMLSYQEPMKALGFKSSMYFPIALYAAALNENYGVEELGRRGMDVYQSMKKNHPLITSGDDYALALLIAGAGKDPDRLESYYNGLANLGFTKSNGLQTLSHILSFSDMSIENAVNKCSIIQKRLKEEKLKISSDYYPAIGLVALLHDPEGQLIDEFVELANYLRTQKKYKWLGKGIHVLFASALIAGEYIQSAQSNVMNTTLQVSIQMIIAAQQAAMIIAISAASASAGN